MVLRWGEFLHIWNFVIINESRVNGLELINAGRHLVLLLKCGGISRINIGSGCL